MSGRLVGEEDRTTVHIHVTTAASSSTTTVTSCERDDCGGSISGSSSSGDNSSSGGSGTSGNAPQRRAKFFRKRIGTIRGPLQSESGGEFTFELVENYPTLGLSAVDDGSGTIINLRGPPRSLHSNYVRHRRKERREYLSALNVEPHIKKNALDPYLPGINHISDLDHVKASLLLKSYPVCSPTLFDVHVSVPPPTCLPEEEEVARTETRGPLPCGPQITEHQARASLLAQVADKCCWGAGAAKQMVIVKIHYDSAFHYELQTYTEKRETSWAFTPYGGGDVDGPIHGPAPLPWDMEGKPSHIFHDEVKVIQVPHTASIKDCHRCKGSGSLQCSECHGKGWTRCLSCHGDGWYTDSNGYKERCFYCQSATHGHGRQDCLKCNAKGRVACPPCDSYGQIRCFIRLTITWKVHTSEHIVRKGGLPEELIKEVSGQVAFEEEGPRICPLTQFPDSTINLASAQLVNNHSHKFTDEKIMSQRHQVRIVPVAEVEYGFKGGPGKFWVYGYENKAYAPNYPQKYCWGCCCCVM